MHKRMFFFLWLSFITVGLAETQLPKQLSLEEYINLIKTQHSHDLLLCEQVKSFLKAVEKMLDDTSVDASRELKIENDARNFLEVYYPELWQKFFPIVNREVNNALSHLRDDYRHTDTVRWVKNFREQIKTIPTRSIHKKFFGSPIPANSFPLDTFCYSEILSQNNPQLLTYWADFLKKSANSYEKFTLKPVGSNDIIIDMREKRIFDHDNGNYYAFYKIINTLEARYATINSEEEAASIQKTIDACRRCSQLAKNKSKRLPKPPVDRGSFLELLINR